MYKYKIPYNIQEVELEIRSFLQNKISNTDIIDNEYIISTVEPLVAQDLEELNMIMKGKHLNPDGYRIYNYMQGRYDNDEAFPFNVDFKTALDITLYKVAAPLVKGEPVETIYYEDSTMQVPVCKLEYEFIRYDRAIFGEGALHGFVKQIIIKLKFYKNDGTLPTQYKDLGTTYNPAIHFEKMMKEGVLKRDLIYQNLKTKVLGILRTALAGTHTEDESKAVGVKFIEENKVSFDNYIDAYNLNIIDDINNNTTDEWLNIVIDQSSGTTVRQFMIGELDLG